MDLVMKLANARGDADAVVARSPDGVLDLSPGDWEQAVAVRGVRFERARLCAEELGVTFTECSFADSAFEGFDAGKRFQGAGNTWKACTFRKLKLTRPIGAGDQFDDCVFEDCVVKEYAAADVTYRRTQFRDVRFTAFGVIPFTRVLFEDCTFERCTFTKSRLGGATFTNCRVENLALKGTDLSGIAGTPAWWTAYESTDPIAVWLDDAVTYVEKQLGTASEAARRFAKFRDDYRAGQVPASAIADLMFVPPLPEEEFEVVEEGITERMKRVRWS